MKQLPNGESVSDIAYLDWLAQHAVVVWSIVCCFCQTQTPMSLSRRLPNGQWACLLCHTTRQQNKARAWASFDGDSGSEAYQ